MSEGTRFTFRTVIWDTDEEEELITYRLMIERDRGGGLFTPSDNVGTTSAMMSSMFPDLTKPAPEPPKWPGIEESYFRHWAKVFGPWEGNNQLKYFKQVGHGEVEWQVCRPRDRLWDD